MMDITSLIVSSREQALLVGDYNSYRAQLSRRLHTLRKKLGRTTPKGKKYSPAKEITAGDIKQDHEFAHLLLLTAERAWAQAMHMKSSHSTGTAAADGLTGSTRKHVISRIHKAVIHSRQLLTILGGRSDVGMSDIDYLEARAYTASLNGAEKFERPDWELCLASFSEARIIYSSLFTSTKREIFKDVMTSTVDPSIRYAAYQSRIPRTIAVPIVARRCFPKIDEDLMHVVTELDPDALRDESITQSEGGADGTDNAPQTIVWRSRTVDIAHASIATTLDAVKLASEKLSEKLSSPASESLSAIAKAAAYDELLIACQDSVDATRDAIEELSGEGVSQTDKRIQALQITRTAVNYALLSRRIGRNRVLTGEQDGMILEIGSVSKGKFKKPRPGGSTSTPPHESKARTLARLTERVVHYGSTLQSIDAVRDLPGVAGDEALLKELQDKTKYFEALRALSIARSHTLLVNLKASLALLSHATSLITSLSPEHFTTSPPSTPLQNLSISQANVHALHTILRSETARHRALVEIDTLTSPNLNKTKNSTPPLALIHNLNEYPNHGADLQNLVTYPPKMEVVPVKPLFLDVAWNYIEYPGRESKRRTSSKAKASVDQIDKTMLGAESELSAETQGKGKKGWFGFGR